MICHAGTPVLPSDQGQYSGGDEEAYDGIADELVASTGALAEIVRAELSVPRHITIIEDAVETEIRKIKRPFWECWWEKKKLMGLRRRLTENRSKRTALVWFGIHGGANADYGMLDLLKLRPILEA